MKKLNNRSRIFVAAALLFGLSTTSAQATNGMLSHGFGINAKALAGATTANSQDSLAAGSNPAGLLKQGNRVDVGVSAFMPDRGFSSASAALPPLGPAQDSGNGIFFIPEFGFNYMLDEKSSVGLSVGGNGGMNTEYNVAVQEAAGQRRAAECARTKVFVNCEEVR